MPHPKKSALFLAALFLLAVSVNAQIVEKQQPLTAEQLVVEGQKLIREKQYDKAVETFRQAIKTNPDSAAGYHGLGGVFISLGRFSEALEYLKTAARLDPNNALIRVNLGINLGNLQRGDEALAELNIAKQLRPDDFRIYNEIGNVYHNAMGRFNDALTAYQEARRLNPNASWVHHNIGLMLMRLARVSEAIEPLQEALKLQPDYRNARYLLSDAYGIVGRYKEAAESWSKFLEIVQNGPEALTKRSWSYLYIGNHGREAAADARKYLDVYGYRDTSSPFLVIVANLGFRDAGMNDEARAVLAAGLKKCSPDDWAYNILRYLNGELDGEQLLKLAIDNDKKTEAHAYLGMDLLIKGKTEEARQHFIWVREYGNKRFFEYPLAAEALKRMN